MGCNSCKKKNIINDESIKSFEKSYKIGFVIGVVILILSIYGLYSLVVKII